MESGLMVFGFEGKEVRAVSINGEPWFVAKDVAETLGYSNPQKAVRDHCKHARPLGVNDSFTLDPQTVVIPEGDAYRLVIRSHMPEAERFEMWLMDDVVPQIRKTGSYVAPVAQHQIPRTFSEALRLAADLQEQLEQQKPLVTFAETCLSSKDAILVRELAKIVTDQKIAVIGEKRLYQKLREWGWVLKGKTEPTQRAMELGVFEVIERPKETAYGTRLFTTTKVTPGGQVRIMERLRGEQQNGVRARLEASSSDGRILQ